MAWAPDRRVLASVAFGQVNLWRPGVDTPVATFSQHTSFVRAVAFSPNGASVASVGEDVRIWRAETREQTAVLDTAPARSVAWSPDGTSVAVGGESGHLQVWRVADRQRLHSSWLRRHDQQRQLVSGWPQTGRRRHQRQGVESGMPQLDAC